MLDEDAAAAFLIERTRYDRTSAADDEKQAFERSRTELGGLALGLEQAGAYIATERIGFARYLKLWRESREKVIGWFDGDLMNYAHDTGLAATWATSVDRLSPESHRLLDRLAMLAPDPIPGYLLEFPISIRGIEKIWRHVIVLARACASFSTERLGGNVRGPQDPIATLLSYSLMTRATVENGVSNRFSVHRLVQDFARRTMKGRRARKTLHEASRWINAALSDDGWDVRAWSILEPLAPHALTLAVRADEAGIADLTTAKLLNKLAILSGAKARFAEALPWCRRALQLDEASIGPYHTDVAGDLFVLAKLLAEMNRFHEAEVHIRRARDLMEMRFGPTDSRVADCNDTLADLNQGEEVGLAKPNSFIAERSQIRETTVSQMIARWQLG